MEKDIYNPLDKENLGRSISSAMLSRPVVPLIELNPFLGAGVYALYYKGNFRLYKPISSQNEVEFRVPIYAGKAVPDGARKGNVVQDSLSGKYLFKRLSEHRKSIEQVENLNVADFYCRYLVVDEIWIPLGESLLIQQTRPLWNNVIDGFGNHDPGKGRYRGKRPLWDTLHPGRGWAENLEMEKTGADIEKMVIDYFREGDGKDSI